MIFLLMLSLLLPLSSHGADQFAPTRARYAAVNKKIAQSTVVKRGLEGYSGEGGELTAYFQNGAPNKIIARHFFNTFRIVDELYFWRGRLFFVSETRESYDMSTEKISARGKVISRRQNCFYFDNGQLTRLINEDGQTIESGTDFETQQKNQLRFAREMLAGARGKTRTIVAPKR